MPLEHSKSKEAFGKNVSDLMHSFKQKGRIGNSPKESKIKARKRALAIAFGIKGGK
jgi:hypothetical protein